MANFFRTAERLLSGLSYATVLDAGCGEGVLLSGVETTLVGRRTVALDRDRAELQTAAVNIPGALLCQADVGQLPFRAGEFELVLCLEVLEHVPVAAGALRELERVCSDYCLLSVPREPLWRMLNMARGAYLTSRGNTPGHVNHWNSKEFTAFVKNSFDILDVRRPLPWTMVLARKRGG